MEAESVPEQKEKTLQESPEVRAAGGLAELQIILAHLQDRRPNDMGTLALDQALRKIEGVVGKALEAKLVADGHPVWDVQNNISDAQRDAARVTAQKLGVRDFE